MTDAGSAPQSDLPIPPGELLAEELAAIEMTPRQFAVETGLPLQIVTDIIQGQAPITLEIALQLERVLGSPAQLWLNLEARYRSVRAHESLFKP